MLRSIPGRRRSQARSGSPSGPELVSGRLDAKWLSGREAECYEVLMPQVVRLREPRRLDSGWQWLAQRKEREIGAAVARFVSRSRYWPPSFDCGLVSTLRESKLDRHGFSWLFRCVLIVTDCGRNDVRAGDRMSVGYDAAGANGYLIPAQDADNNRLKQIAHGGTAFTR